MDCYGNVEAEKQKQKKRDNHEKKKVEILVNTVQRCTTFFDYSSSCLFSHLTKGSLKQGCYELKKSALL